MAKKKNNDIFEQSSIQNSENPIGVSNFEQTNNELQTFENPMVTSDLANNDKHLFEQSYKDLHFGGFDLFCVLTPDRIAASAEFGFIAPTDNKNWDEDIIFYPEYDLGKIEKQQDKPCLFVKVPLKWAKFCYLKNDDGVCFISQLNSMFPFSEVIEYYVSPIFKREVDTKLFYNEDNPITYTTQANWKLLKKHILQGVFKQEHSVFDKMLGGVLVSVIEEVFGKLIDSGKILTGSKYIEPFSPYPINDKTDKLHYDTIILGKQGFGLLYSLMAYLNEGQPTKFESLCLKEIQKSEFQPLPQVKAEFANSLLCYIPLIFRHFENLKEGNAKLFRDELEDFMRANEIETSVENQWAVVLFAGFSAKALANDLWDNGIEGGKKSFDIIKKLKESVADTLFPNGTDDLTSDKAHKSLVFLKKIADIIKPLAETSKFGKIIEIPTSFEEEVIKGDNLHCVVASLCVLWATDTMSKDWFNVFNRAFNGNLKGLSNVFPILGAWMGFLHGYKKIRRRKNFKFSNADFIETLTINSAKKSLNNEFGVFDFSLQNKPIKSFEFTSGTKELKILQFVSGFELPILQEIKTKELETLKTQLKDFQELIKELDKKQESEAKIQSIVRRNKN